MTGGNGGLGLAMARGLVKAKASVAVWGRNSAKIDDAVRTLRDLSSEFGGGDVEGFACDVTSEEDVEKAFADTLSRFDKVDSCFANAGGGGISKPLHELSTDDWRANIDLNLTSVFLTFRPVIQHLLQRKAPGKLVVTSSAAAILGTPRNAAYSATKAAVAGLVRALAVELGAAGIQANAILPGFIETDMSLSTPDFFQEACKRRIVTGHEGKLDSMEGAAVYLASPQSDFMTGQTMVLDGGQSVNPF